MSSPVSRAGQRRPSAAAILLIIVLALCLCSSATISVAALSGGPRKNPVVQCGDDFNRICDVATSARDLWGCMMKNMDKISNEACREYVIGFHACTRDAEKRGSCVYPAADYATAVRRCLRNMPESAVSKECLSSQFYLPIADARNAMLKFSSQDL
ncbi:hypothetical protein ABL78_3785 [Leptomonas seymouri]|uniref:Uncharacterized protein n=1 Tax=Leptomonas seymouri TaxID=5684 RepID=A0A0N1HZ33_LEPSE|nr:hypothetical protein ABL78_3785 [Leptomonas seymouri]|eukprot:KPI87132.1 hypothetical protein ABL78_3785 [Leptomonas seymouri]